jgi:hypothetical protein
MKKQKLVSDLCVGDVIVAVGIESRLELYDSQNALLTLNFKDAVGPYLVLEIIPIVDARTYFDVKLLSSDQHVGWIFVVDEDTVEIVS